MSELARRRSARDIWISRGHLYALGAGAALAMLACFAVGYGVGRSSVDLPEPAATRFAGEAGDEALVELLARVDAAATPDGGVRDLTFPDALRGEAGTLTIPAAPAAAGSASLEGGAIALPEAGDAPPAGRWTVIAASVDDRAAADSIAASLRERELEAWVGVEQNDGRTRFRVAVGGWGSKSEAEEALDSLQARIEAGGGTASVASY
ncbi:MAG: SPOR domain-containing protein [Alphaproteobacteria bacterium]|nr:SPOR domain-containing protein [Alphaproteobacteria bacterium]